MHLICRDVVVASVPLASSCSNDAYEYGAT